jgi:hypothetical protein
MCSKTDYTTQFSKNLRILFIKTTKSIGRIFIKLQILFQFYNSKILSGLISVKFIDIVS